MLRSCHEILLGESRPARMAKEHNRIGFKPPLKKTILYGSRNSSTVRSISENILVFWSSSVKKLWIPVVAAQVRPGYPSSSLSTTTTATTNNINIKKHSLPLPRLIIITIPIIKGHSHLNTVKLLRIAITIGWLVGGMFGGVSGLLLLVHFFLVYCLRVTGSCSIYRT